MWVSYVVESAVPFRKHDLYQFITSYRRTLYIQATELLIKSYLVELDTVASCLSHGTPWFVRWGGGVTKLLDLETVASSLSHETPLSTFMLVGLATTASLLIDRAHWSKPTLVELKMVSSPLSHGTLDHARSGCFILEWKLHFTDILALSRWTLLIESYNCREIHGRLTSDSL